jgi:hypothetical protein
VRGDSDASLGEDADITNYGPAPTSVRGDSDVESLYSENDNECSTGDTALRQQTKSCGRGVKRDNKGL